jgi:hypothetical protein
MYAQRLSFERPDTFSSAKAALQRSVGDPLKIWEQDNSGIIHLYRKQ